MAIQTVPIEDVEAETAVTWLHPGHITGELLALALLTKSTFQDFSTKAYISGVGGIAVTWGGTIELLAPNEQVDLVCFDEGGTWIAFEAKQGYLRLISSNPTLVNPVMPADPPIGIVHYSTGKLLPAGVSPIAYSNTAEDAYKGQFEAAYRGLGRVRGRDGTAEARAENRTFWLHQGLRGAMWLIERLRQEVNVDILDAAAAVLRQMDKEVLAPIIAELQRKPNPELAEALIRALRRPHLLEDAAENYSGLYSIIEDYFGDPAPEVRQAAYEVASKLAKEDANRLLQEAQRQESDPELIEVIRELRQERSVGS